MADLGDLSHMDLLMARRAPGADQQALAPAEHQAFAREYAAENPFLATGLALAIPAYQVAKGVGLIGSRSGTTQPFTQMGAGFKGLGQGWMQALKSFLGTGAQAQAAGVTQDNSVGASAIDRRGADFGVPPLPPLNPFAGSPAPVVAPPPAPTPTPFESEYARELSVIRGGRNSVGAQSLKPQGT